MLFIPYITSSLYVLAPLAKYKKGDKVLSISQDVYIIEGVSTKQNHRPGGQNDIFYCGVRIKDHQRDCKLPESQLKLVSDNSSDLSH